MANLNKAIRYHTYLKDSLDFIGEYNKDWIVGLPPDDIFTDERYGLAIEEVILDDGCVVGLGGSYLLSNTKYYKQYKGQMIEWLNS